MNWIDIVILVILAVSALRGLQQGLIQQALAVIGFIVGLYAAIGYHARVAALLDSALGIGRLATFVAFVLILAAAWLIAALIAALLRGGLKAIGLAWTDNLFGFIDGLLVGLLIVSLFVLLLARVPLTSVRGALAGSVIASYVLRLLPHLQPWIPKNLPVFESTVQSWRQARAVEYC